MGSDFHSHFRRLGETKEEASLRVLVNGRDLHKIKGMYWYNYRAVDKYGDIIDYYLSKHRDEAAAKAFLNKAIAQNGLPEKVVIDGSNTNHAALDAINV